MRAKAGVQAGDIQKEAHMSFCLGVMNEDMKRYIEVLFAVHRIGREVLQAFLLLCPTAGRPRWSWPCLEPPWCCVS